MTFQGNEGSVYAGKMSSDARAGDEQGSLNVVQG